MTPASVSTVPGSPVAPLFAHNARLWLRVWAATQGAALGVALYVIVSQGAGRATGIQPALIELLVLLAAYHVIGVLAYRWILRRTWAVLLFVPLGWVLVVSALQISGAFGLLILGAILQGFIFLPFAWAATVLGLVTTGLATSIALRAKASGIVAVQIGGILATGVMIGTVLLYIHRANQEAELRTRLLRQLDEAQRDLADRARDAGVQEERRRFARDIHDTLAQGFTSVIKHLEAIELSLGPPGARHDESIERMMPHLAHAQAVSRSSLADIRRLVWSLQPAELTEASLAAALGRVVAQWSEANAIPATFTSDALPALHPDADVIFLRATQESLSNVARHAEAASVAVSLSAVDGLALLTVEDDGRGFAHVDAHGVEKMGLAGMRERVRRFGGHLLIDSAVGEGTSLTVAMPLSSIAATYRAAESMA